MTRDELIHWLFAVTLIIVLALAICSYFRTRRAQRTNSPAVPSVRQPDGTVVGERPAERRQVGRSVRR